MKNAMKHLLLTIIWVMSHVVQANNPANYAFSRINGEIGLSQNRVKAIIQDADGFIWLGTQNKLNRYDGTSFRVFNCEDSIQRQQNNSISALHEDRDGNIWVGTDNGIFLFNPLKESFTFFNAKSGEGIGINEWVADIIADKDNNIWVVIPNQGLFRYNIFADTLHYYQFQSVDMVLPDQGNPQCICLDYTGKLWVGTNGAGVYAYNKADDTFKQYLGDNRGNTLLTENIYTMCDYGDELIIGIHEGSLRRLNKKQNTVQDVNVPSIHNKVIRHVTCIGSELWIGTQQGLYIVNELYDTVVNIKEDLMDGKSLSDNSIEKIFKDREGGIWIGTSFMGVNYLPPRSMKFDRFVLLDNQNSIRNKMVSSLLEDRDGNIWIASVNSVIDIYNPQTGMFQHLETNQQSWVSGLFEDRGNVVVGYFKNGADLISVPDHKIKHYTGEDLGLNEATIYTIYRDRMDRLWVGNGWSVFILDERKSKELIRQPQFGMNFVYDIVEDADSNIWVATLGNGVYKYNQVTEQTTHYRHAYGNPTSISSNSINSMYVDSFGKVWFSTDRGGICCYNKERNNFTAYSIKDGLPDDVTYKILEDKDHNLWFGTNNGLVRFNPETQDVRVFRQSQGLPGNHFLNKAALASKSGKFYFGGVEGMVAFDPEHFDENSYIPPVFITKLSIYNKEVEIGLHSPLQQSITHSRKITLRHDQANIGFDFVALSYATPHANRYAYKMENIDNDWIYTGKPQVSYAKLPPGKYVFKVKASNNDGLWNSDGTYLDIEILPPWWLARTACIIYCLLTIAAIALWFYWYNKRINRQQHEQQRLFEAEKEREMYVSKVNFFTNIAHEIRTPVTLINCPLESLLEMDIENAEIRKNLETMKKNTSELQNLISQLLDFRKVGENKFQVSFSTINFPDFMQDIYARFEPTAAQNNKQVTINISHANLPIQADREGMTKILSNLFSNALTYSDHRIVVDVRTHENQLVFRISNDGRLIPKELKERIFDPFYQMEQNKNRESTSGIGLSLARSLAELHNGELFLDVNDASNNTFVLNIPLQQALPDSSVLENEVMPEESESEQVTATKETILVVEDNSDLRTFIVDKLSKHHKVSSAKNAQDALNILHEKRIDLIVSDIMMPDMDGFELCRQIKADIEHSHVPIILLTAKHDLSSKIKGLESGADAYIEKPFSFKHLTSQIATLLTNRKREKEAFIQKPFIAVQQMGMTKADELFLERTIEIIDRNITDINFTMEFLAEQVFLSRSSLHRKIKALTGLSPADFVRLVRLKKAAEIIQRREHSIGEVCYLVGIHSPSYFTKIFHKQFGMTPREFRDATPTM